jgi:hypothetical protein
MEPRRGGGDEGAWTRRLLVVLYSKRWGMVAVLYYPDHAPSSAAAAPACVRLSVAAREEYGDPA